MNCEKEEDEANFFLATCKILSDNIKYKRDFLLYL